MFPDHLKYASSHFQSSGLKDLPLGHKDPLRPHLSFQERYFCAPWLLTCCPVFVFTYWIWSCQFQNSQRQHHSKISEIIHQWLQTQTDFTLMNVTNRRGDMVLSLKTHSECAWINADNLNKEACSQQQPQPSTQHLGKQGNKNFPDLPNTFGIEYSPLIICQGKKLVIQGSSLTDKTQSGQTK